jgi:molybdenum cofactor cytidylyltransferase
VDNSPVALILSAGLSSRMPLFKPLCPIGNEVLIDRVIRTLQEGGLERIFIVTGYKSERLEEHLKEKEVTLIHNDRYEEGMFSSVQIGISSLPQEVSGALLLPVDYPFIRSQTIASLVRTFQNCSADVIFPVYEGKKGHPPLIRQNIFSAILKDRGEQGLRGVLNRTQYIHEYRETGDEAILYDMDNDEARSLLLNKFKDRLN